VQPLALVMESICSCWMSGSISISALVVISRTGPANRCLSASIFNYLRHCGHLQSSAVAAWAKQRNRLKGLSVEANHTDSLQRLLLHTTCFDFYSHDFRTMFLSNYCSNGDGPQIFAFIKRNVAG